MRGRRSGRGTSGTSRPFIPGSRSPWGEVEVLTFLARGLSNKQIAQRLVITPKTASNHIEHVYTKINASSRTTAAMFAVKHGLLPEKQFVSTEHLT
jgi:DNA-binding NarL/FixJ family response regulator